MPELPEEIWTMIAKHVKREPPAVGEAGNWNDHFHQQDLTSLMRVNSVSALVPFLKNPLPVLISLGIAIGISVSQYFSVPNRALFNCSLSSLLLPIFHSIQQLHQISHLSGARYTATGKEGKCQLVEDA